MIQQFAIRPVGGGGGGITAVNFSAGTTSGNISNVVFSNSNNVTFGLNGSTVTASASFATVQGSINLSAGTTSTNASAFTFSNSNGVSFGLGTGANAGIVTATVGTNYAGTVFATTTSAGTAIAGTLNTSGLTLGVPAFLTTAALSQDSSKYAGTNFATTTSAGTAIAGTLNTSGLTLGVPPFLTTAMQSNAATISNINVSAGTTSTNASAFTFSNSNGVSFGLGTGASAGVITASYTVPTVTNSSLTLSDAATSLTIARLAFTNSNGLTLTLSTAAGGSATLIGSYSQSGQAFSAGGGSSTFSTLSFSNANGVSFTNTNGQVAASIATSLTNINVSAGTTSTNASAFTFSNGSNVSFGLGTGASAGVITASVATSLTNINISAGTTSNNLSAVTFSNSNDISFGLNASTITADIRNFKSYWFNSPLFSFTSAINVAGSTSNICPFVLPYYMSISYIRLPASFQALVNTFATTANTTFSASILSTWNAVVYSLGTGASSNSLQSVASGSAPFAEQWSWQAGTAGSQWSVTEKITYPTRGTTSQFTTSDFNSTSNLSIQSSQLTGFHSYRFIDIPFANSLSPGPYWLMVGISSTTSTQGNAAGTQQIIGASTLMMQQGNIAMGDLVGSVPGSVMQQLGIGSFSTNAIGTTASLDLSNITRSANMVYMKMEFIRQA